MTLQETGRLVKIPGIGKKTAERLLLELRDRLPKAVAGSVAADNFAPAPADDILNALMALGYNEREVLPVLKTLPEGVAVSEGIRQALKLLSRA